MGLFSRFSNEPTKVVINGKGNFSQEILGESDYQEPLKRICGGYKEDEHNYKTLAELKCEDDDEYDSEAVCVMINNRIVGYLHREDAGRFRRRLKKSGHNKDTIVICDAVIIGGWKRGFFDRGDFGVRLDIDLERPFEITPQTDS